MSRPQESVRKAMGKCTRAGWMGLLEGMVRRVLSLRVCTWMGWLAYSEFIFGTGSPTVWANLDWSWV